VQSSALRELWENPAHWTAGFYRCGQDPRLWVERRAPGSGTTLNLAHRRAWVSASLLIAAAVPPPAAVMLLGANHVRALVVVFGASVLAAGAVFAVALAARKDVARRSLTDVGADKRG
jgi:hypothetical protein